VIQHGKSYVSSDRAAAGDALFCCSSCVITSLRKSIREPKPRTDIASAGIVDDVGRRRNHSLFPLYAAQAFYRITTFLQTGTSSDIH